MKDMLNLRDVARVAGQRRLWVVGLTFEMMIDRRVVDIYIELTWIFFWLSDNSYGQMLLHGYAK